MLARQNTDIEAGRQGLIDHRIVAVAETPRDDRLHARPGNESLRLRPHVAQLAKPGLERLDRLDRANAHLERKRPARGVIRRLGRPAGIGAPLRVELPLHHVFQVRSIRLRRQQHVSARRIPHAAGRERLVRQMHLNAGLMKNMKHRQRRPGIALSGKRDDPGIRRLLFSQADGLLAQRQVVLHEVVAIAGGQRKERHIGDFLILDRIAQPPPAPRPRIGKIDRGRILRKAPPAAAQVAIVLKDRRGQLGARGLGQNADDVVPIRRGAVPALPPVIEDGLEHHAGLTALLQLGRHMPADDQQRLVDERIDVGVDRVEERRHEESRPAIAHLMHVVQNRRMPLVIQQLG